eukprot:4965928-Amphidinium_carterae.1
MTTAQFASEDAPEPVNILRSFNDIKRTPIRELQCDEFCIPGFQQNPVVVLLLVHNFGMHGVLIRLAVIRTR